MPASTIIFALALMAADAPAPAAPPQGEPLPAGAPTQDYPLTAWCYGAMSEYLAIYERVKPDLKAIDKMFGSSEPNEPQPYASDMAAAHKELQVLADAVTAAEKASPSPIAPQGGEAIKQGRSVWAPAEAKTNRELARAWLSWALPDRCDTTARTLASKSALLGQALKYNTPPPEAEATAPPPASDATGAPPAEATQTAPTTSEAAPPSPTVSDTGPGAQASPDVTPPPAPATPQVQPDPNAPIPDPAPPRP
jgi:hypothetical protein